MEMNKFYLFIILICALACTVKERPIKYGSDECDYCKMTIMDHRYGAELVTQKGKVYTFDAVECLINYLYYNEEEGLKAGHLLVTPYTLPDQLFDATRAIYLVSKEMPSPMGAYLTAFSEKHVAEKLQEEKGGDLYTWEELYHDFRAIKRNAIEAYE